ncbi:MAG: hypothetical protein AABY22_20750 [Nanoarchaeota archaeon]
MKGFFKFGCPIIKLSIENKEIEILLDTGFNGHIMLSENIINELNLEKIGTSDYSTASGEDKITEVFKAKIKFFDEEIEIPILSTTANISLAGMELFYNCKIIIERQKDLMEIIKTI